MARSGSLPRTSTSTLAAALCVLAACARLAGAFDPVLASRLGEQPNPVGYHEGARRRLACDGGYVAGFEAYMTHLGGFSEPTVNALRVVCSSGRVLLEYEADSLTDALVYGNLPAEDAAVPPIRVVCPAGSAVAAIDWRRVPGAEKDTTARIAGMRIHCGTESSAQPLIVDSKPRQEYPASLKCSQTKNAPAGTRFKLTAVEIWHEQLLAGLHMINCDSG